MVQPPGITRRARSAFVVFGLLHLACCGVPLLLLSGVSLAFVAPYWPVGAAALAVVGALGFGWHLKRGCATCPPSSLDQARPERGR